MSRNIEFKQSNNLLAKEDKSKIVIKIGTAAIFNSKTKKIKKKVIKQLAKDISNLIKDKHEIILVSSGAVGCGKKYIQGDEIGIKQVQAAIGQIRLMEIYSKYFKKKGLIAAQFLLNPDDLRNKSRLKNLQETYSKIEKNIIPIVNENDVTCVEELSFGDNDSLSSELTLKMDFDILIILTEIGALIKNNQVLQKSSFFDVEDYDKMKIKAKGFGGLKTKLDCAKKITFANKKCFIAKAGDSIFDILNKKAISTEFISQ